MNTAKINHNEQHFSSTDTVRDTIIGVSDGLTVPFALSVGLTGTILSSNIKLTALKKIPKS